jgi:hypothetical protein
MSTARKSGRLASLSVCTLLALSSASAVQTATTAVPLNATTQSACQFDTANANATIDLPDYEAALAATSASEQAQVSVSVYCNKGTPISARRLAGNVAANSAVTAITLPLTLEGVAGSPTFEARLWYTAGPSNAVTSGVFKGAQRYVTVIRAGWPTAPQYRAPTGFYTGTVDFTVEF